MSGYLGYDPDLLPALLAAMNAAETELSGFRFSAPEIQPSIRMVNNAARTLRDEWIPLVRGLINCSALTGYKPATIDDGDLLNSYLARMIAANGWRTSTDPAEARCAPMSMAEAANLALWINGHVDELDGDDFLALADKLAIIAAGESLSRALIRDLSPEALRTLVNLLGTIAQAGAGRPAIDDDPTTGLWSSAPASLASLGTVLANVLANDAANVLANDDGAPSALDLLADLDPYGAALILQQLDLGAAELGEVAVAIIANEVRIAEDNLGHYGARAADVVLATVLATADGPSRFLVASAAHPEYVFTPADVALTDQILLRGTGPLQLSPSEQQVVLPALFAQLAVVGDADNYIDPYYELVNVYSLDPNFGDVAAAVIAPYAVRLFILEKDGFGLSKDTASAIWNFIVDNPMVLAPFLADRSAGQFDLDVELGVDPRVDRVAITELSQSLAILNQLYAQDAINQAELANAQWAITWQIIETVTGYIPLGSVGGFVLGYGIDGLRSALEASGWGPDSVDHVRADALDSNTTALAIGASVVIGSMFTTMVANREIRLGVAPPPVPDLDADNVPQHYIESLDEWVETAGIEEPARSRLLLASDAILNPGQAASNTLTQLGD